MQIIGGRLCHDDGAPFQFIPSPNHGGRIEPTLIVLHDTADRLKADDTISWFRSAASKVSAHFVVGRDGSVVQMVDCGYSAWHAGKSEWRGRPFCNGFSIGIEIDNPGLLRPLNSSTAVAWFGEKFDRAGLIETDSSCHTHGAGCWMPHTEAQLVAVEGIVKALLAAYPTIREVVGHFEISPGRKVDPNPSFPMAHFKALAPDPDGITREMQVIADAQARLAQLGYWHGATDGVLGPLTRQAVRTFQEQNAIGITGELDGKTLLTLADDRARAMPGGAREGLTADDVGKVSSTVAAAANIQRALTVAGGLGLGVASSTPAGEDAPVVVPTLPPVDAAVAIPKPSLEAIDGALAKVEAGRAIGDRALSLLDWVWTPRGAVMIAIILALMAAGYLAGNVKLRRVIAARLGWHLQPN